MTSNMTRIPLAIAMTAALAFSVGCANDRDNANTTTGAQTADGRADTTTPPPVGTAGNPAMDNTQRTGMNNDGPDSDQPGTDTWITTKVKSSLLADSDVSGLDIKVETVNGVVTLTGRVDQQMQIEEATRIAREIEGVKDVRTTGLTVNAAGNQ